MLNGPLVRSLLTVALMASRSALEAFPVKAGSRLRILGFRFEFRVWGLGLRASDLKLREQGLGLSVSGLGLRFRV